MDLKENIILKVEDDSIASELEICVGDVLVTINKKEVIDIFDYRYLIYDDYLEVLIRNKNGEETIYVIEKDEDEDLGIVFEHGIMDDAKSCTNKCVFCFIDQLPKGMRETLYFKDDDSRLSFLQGNYVTLTNMKSKDIDRILFYHLSPINISVHTTDKKLRKFMLKNPHSDNLMENIKKFSDAGIEMNFQVVLCKDLNDKENLDKTIEDLSEFIGKGKSLSIVPVGISKYRDGLYEIQPFKKEDCEDIILQIQKWQTKLKRKYGTRFVYASDEFYLLAHEQLPDYTEYEDFPQIENGVGMISNMNQEFHKELKKLTTRKVNRKVDVVTGVIAYDFIKSLCIQLEQSFKGLSINVHKIENDFFGEHITVSGLLTGIDIINALKSEELGDCILIPMNCLRSDDTVFLDNVDIKDMESELKTRVIPVKTEGKDFIQKILNIHILY